MLAERRRALKNENAVSLVTVDEEIIPEANIESMHQRKGAGGRWEWAVHLKDRDAPIASVLAPATVLG